MSGSPRASLWRWASGCEGVVFDLDGTLIDSAPQILAAAKAALGPERRIEPSDIGPPLSAMLSKALGGNPPEAQLLRAVEDFKRAYDGACCDSPAFPGAGEALAELRSWGVPMALATNKRSALAGRILSSKGWAELFPMGALGMEDFGGGFGSKADGLRRLSASSKIHASRLAMVGDSASDFEAARAAGFGFYLHCPWGADPRWRPKGSSATRTARLAEPGDWLDPVAWLMV